MSDPREPAPASTLTNAAAEAPAASAFARIGALVYALLTVYGSWYPLSGWRSVGIAPWAFLFAPFPHYWTGFDLTTNVLAYMPFGLLMLFALYPAVRGWKAVLVTVACGALLSGLLEAGQTFLPSRVPSNLDLLPNTAGALIGALMGILLSRIFLEQSRFLKLRKDWFARDAGRGLMVLSLWPLSQIYPQAYLFGHGQILPFLSVWLSDLFDTDIDLGELLRNGAELTVQEYWLAETIIAACGYTGALLTLLCLLRPAAPKASLLIVTAAFTLGVKALAHALLFNPGDAFAWLTPGARGGLLIGTMMLAGLAFARPAAQRRLAAISLMLSVAAVNVVPVSPYFTATLQAWLQGKFLNFNGAAQFISLVWPFFALWFLLHPMHRMKRG
jgi:VanZ family protein